MTYDKIITNEIIQSRDDPPIAHLSYTPLNGIKVRFLKKYTRTPFVRVVEIYFFFCFGFQRLIKKKTQLTYTSNQEYKQG